MKSTHLIPVAAAAVLLWAGCATPVARFDDPNAPIEVAQGQSFEIALPSNPTTGYSWALAHRLDNHVLTLANTEYHRADPAVVGSGGVETWRFIARHEGSTSITLVYHRPWEKDSQPPTTRVYRVSVRKASPPP